MAEIKRTGKLKGIKIKLMSRFALFSPDVRAAITAPMPNKIKVVRVKISAKAKRFSSGKNKNKDKIGVISKKGKKTKIQ